jgi:hypothetical protein
MSTKADRQLAALEKVARELNIEVSYDRLKYAGLILKSGLCTYRGRQILFIERRKKPQEKIDVLVEVLSAQDLSAVEVPPEAAGLLPSRPATSPAC